MLITVSISVYICMFECELTFPAVDSIKTEQVH